MKTRIPEFIFAGIGAIALAGCVTHTETVVRDVDRTTIEFENDAAARIFYEALSKMPDPRNRSESTTEVSIPVIFEHKRHVVTGPNAAFNEAVAKCDSNKDGRITELEAKIFSENFTPPGAVKQ
jgi:hypothetical protein